MQITNYVYKKILNYIFNGAEFKIPSIHVGLSTYTGPTKCGFIHHEDIPPSNIKYLINREVSGDNYARVEVPIKDYNPDNKENKVTVTFNTPTSSWGEVRYMLIYDAATGGNLLAFAPIRQTKIEKDYTLHITIPLYIPDSE